MTCRSCGAALILDTRLRREVCDPCRRDPAVCPCRPLISAVVPEWVRRAREGRGVPKVWSSAA